MFVKYLSLVFGAIIEVYCIDKFNRAFQFNKKVSNRTYGILISLIGLFQIGLSIFFNGVPVAICFFCSSLFIALLYDSKLFNKIIICISITAINISAELVFGGLFMLFSNGSHELTNTTPEAYAIGTILSKFLVFIIVQIIESSKRTFGTSNIKRGHLILLSVLPVTSIVTSILMYQIIDLVELQSSKLFYIICNFMLVLSNIITFEVVRRQDQLAQRENEINILKNNIDIQKNHYEDLLSSQEEVKRIRHDIKSRFLGILALLKSGRVDDGIVQIQDDLNVLKDTENAINTGHPAIDAVIERKEEICKNNNILLNLTYNYLEKITISEVEIAVVLGNILDNAIESCEKIKNDKKQIIGIIASDKQNIIIDIKNSSFKNNGLKSTKNNKDEHGYGLKSISHIAERHNGYAKYTYNESEFRTFVIMDN